MKILILNEDFDSKFENKCLNDRISVLELDGRYKGNKDIQRLRIQSFFSYNDLYSFNLLAKEICNDWYKSNNNQDLSYIPELGVGFGELLKFSLGSKLSRLFRYVFLLEKILQSGIYDEIIVWGGQFNFLNKLLEEKYKIKIYVWEKDISFLFKVYRKVKNYINSFEKKFLFNKRLNVGYENKDHFIFGDKIKIFVISDVVVNDITKFIAKKLKAKVYFSFSDFLTQDESLFLSEKLKQKYIEIVNIFLESDKCKVFCARIGFWFYDAIKKILYDFSFSIIRILIQSFNFNKFLEDKKVDLLITPICWGGFERSAIFIAKKNKIPSVSISDGILINPTKAVLSEMVADYAIVLGKSNSIWFQKSKKVLCIGTQIFKFIHFKTVTKFLDNTDSVDRGKIKILYFAPRPANHFAQYSYFEAEEQIEIICNTLSGNTRYKVYIKFHPRTILWPGKDWLERMERYAYMKGCIIVTEDENFLEKNDFFDIVICYESTTVIKSLFYNKKILVVDFSGRTTDYEELPVAHKSKDIVYLIEKLLHNKCDDYLQIKKQVFDKHISDQYSLDDILLFIKKGFNK